MKALLHKWEQISRLVKTVAKWTWDANILTSIAIASLCINCLALAFPLTLLQVYDRIIPRASTSTLSVLVMIVVSAIAIEAVLRVLRAMMIGWADAQFAYRTSCRGFNAILDTRIDEYDKYGPGALLEKMNALNYMKDFYGGQALVALIDVPFVLLYLGLFTYLAGNLVIVPLIILTGFIAVAMFYGNKTRDILSSRRHADDRRLNFIIEVLAKIHSIKSMSMENLFARRYERLQQITAQTDHQLCHFTNRTQMFSTLLSQCNVIFVVAFGALIVMNDSLSIGGLAACTLLANRSLGPISKAMGVWRRLQSIVVAEERLQELIDLPNEFSATQTSSPITTVSTTTIKLDNVSFHYPGSDKQILHNLNLTIPSKQTLAISTDQYGGKTTLVMLLMGLLKPTNGTMAIDGIDINRINVVDWRERIAYIPEKGTLFKGTILENITLFRDQTCRTGAIEVVRQLGFESAIAALPNGFETLVGDRLVSTLPLGLQQQICIARALINHTDIIIFDEGNSSLDREANQKLIGAFAALEKRTTLILFTHCQKIMSFASRVVQLSKGTIVEKEVESSTDTNYPIEAA